MSELIAYRGEAAHDIEHKKLVELKMQLDGARSEWAAISAKRQNRVVDRRIRGYNAAQARYNQLVVEYGRQSLAESLRLTADRKQRTLIAASYVIEMQNRLRAETDAITEGKRTRRFARKIGNWLTRGSKRAQFVKSASVSMAAGAIGGIFGMAKATVAVAGFAKGYLTSERQGLQALDVAQEVHAYEPAMHDEDDIELLSRVQGKSAETFDSAGREQQAGKRSAVKRGMGRAAMGFAMGAGVDFMVGVVAVPLAHAMPLSDTTYHNPGLSTASNPGLVDVQPYQSLDLGNSYESPGFQNGYDTLNLATPETSPTSYDSLTIADDYNSLPLSDHVHTSLGLDDGNTDATSVDTADYESLSLQEEKYVGLPLTDNYESLGLNGDTTDHGSSGFEFGKDELNIDCGEGWYQTFNEMGIDPAHHKELLQQVGPELKHIKVDDMPIAYKEDGQWYMNMTDDSKMPEKAIELIAKTAHDHGWHSDYDKFFEAPSSTESAPADLGDKIAEYADGRDEAVISKGEGGMKFASEMGIHGAHDQLAVWNDVAPKFEDQGLTYQMSDGEWRLSMTPDGQMPHDMIQAMAENAHEQGINSNYSHLFEATSSASETTDSTTGASSVADTGFRIYDTEVNPASGNATSELSADSGIIAPNFTVNEFGSTPTEATGAYYEAFKDLHIDQTQADKLLNAVAYELQNVKGSDGVALTYRTSDGVWHFRETAGLPREAKDVLARVADKYNWTTAS